MPTITGRAAAAAAIAGLATLLLSGCNPFDAVNREVEEAIESQTGGEVNLDGELPSNFPESVPLIDGDVTFAAGAGGEEGWVVIISSSAADGVADAVTALEGAGFSEDRSATGPVGTVAAYSDSEYVVFLAGDGNAVTYTVAPKS
ncbi:hypothetical protein [Agromyces sp. Marseille-P2726]|uniref:hypothetical protein n=1 Tax=Agromyces sp. Marseille-P2726 TaxID=2709132 RepID=UPI0015704B9D|nr:hypothetical protein [Agromyces sp. Marseille-P2726]